MSDSRQDALLEQILVALGGPSAGDSPTIQESTAETNIRLAEIVALLIQIRDNQPGQPT